MKKARNRLGILLFLAALFLFNPNLSVFDILPDFIGYLLVILALFPYADLIPHFDTAVGAAKKLLAVTAAKVPAFFVVSAFVAGDARQRVLFTLASFSFAILELIWFFSLLRELYAGLSYLGERFGLLSIIRPREGKKASGMTHARRASYICLTAKTVLSTLPDFALLFSYDSSGDFVSGGRDLASFWPLLTAMFALVALGFGIAFLICFLPFAWSLFRDEQLPALIGEVRKESEAALRGLPRIRRIRAALLCLCGGVFCMLDIVLDGVNYLPDPLGILLFGIAAALLLPFCLERAKGALIFAVPAFLLSLANYTVRYLFFAEHSYAALGRIIAADKLYSLHETLSVCEAAAVVLLCLIICRMLFSLIDRDTGYVSDNINNYSSHLPLHKALKIKAGICTAFGILASFAGAADVILRRITERYKLGAADGNGEVAGGVILPVYGWFWLIVLGLGVLWLAYSLYFAAVMNQEVEHKYSLS